MLLSLPLPHPGGKAGLMRKFKTADKSRTNYCYYEDGKKIVITPEQVDSKWISYLHDADDAEVDTDRKEEYHIPVHYDAYETSDEEVSADCNSYMEDSESNPLEQIIKAIDESEYEDKIVKLKSAIQTLQPQQIVLINKVFYENQTITSVAEENGVTEAAIRHRLKKIYMKLEKIISI